MNKICRIQKLCIFYHLHLDFFPSLVILVHLGCSNRNHHWVSHKDLT